MKKLLLFLILVMIPFNTYAITDTARSTIVMDMDSKRILYEKNANEPRLIASITKIMTAVVAIEEGSLDEEVTVGEEVLSMYGSNIYIELGEKMTLRNLLYGLMLRSGNDAAVVIAKHIAGSEEKFVNNVQEQFSKVSYKHVYTEFYQKKFESKCLWLYDVMTVNNQFKCIGRFFAKIIKKMVKSLWLFDIVSRFDKNHVPSHIIVLAEN